MSRVISRRENFRTILRYLKPFAPLLALSMLCALATVAAQLAVPYFIGEAIDCIIGENNVHYEEIFSIFVAIGACIAVAFVAQYLLSLINNRIVFHLLAQVREDAFAKLQRLPLK